MSEFKVNIRTDNAAFDDEVGWRSETARILRRVVASLEGGAADFDKAITLLDINGNDVGRAKLHQEES